MNQGGKRLRVLVSAYAFGPSDESEASAGWAFAVAAARSHEVWVVTRLRYRAEIEAALDADPALASRLHVDYLDNELLMRFKRGQFGVYWYYALWQRALARRARQLHAVHHFDVAHHVTFASDWLPCGLAQFPKEVPVIWGPVGGATLFPGALGKWVSRRSMMTEVLRDRVTEVMRRGLSERMARRASLVVCQNHEVARRFEGFAPVEVEPNAAFREEPAPFVPGDQREPRKAVYVGRLVGWKGVRLAVSCFADPRLSDWTFDLYGAGAEESWIRDEIDRLGLQDRVVLKGHRPRTEILEALSTARVMVFPSLHDSAGWVAGEASSSGCPVVCLDIGGPPLLAGPNALSVAPDENVLENLVQAILASQDHEGVAYHRWQLDRLPDVVDRWYATVPSSTQRSEK